LGPDIGYLAQHVGPRLEAIDLVSQHHDSGHRATLAPAFGVAQGKTGEPVRSDCCGGDNPC
jgi:hypothetical protein